MRCVVRVFIPDITARLDLFRAWPGISFYFLAGCSERGSGGRDRGTAGEASLPVDMVRQLHIVLTATAWPSDWRIRPVGGGRHVRRFVTLHLSPARLPARLRHRPRFPLHSAAFTLHTDGVKTWCCGHAMPSGIDGPRRRVAGENPALGGGTDIRPVASVSFGQEQESAEVLPSLVGVVQAHLPFFYSTPFCGNSTPPGRAQIVAALLAHRLACGRFLFSSLFWSVSCRSRG